MRAADVFVHAREAQDGGTGTSSPARRGEAERHVIDMAPHNPGLRACPTVKLFDRCAQGADQGPAQGVAAPILAREDSIGAGGALWGDERLHAAAASAGDSLEAAAEAAASWRGIGEPRPAAADRSGVNGDSCVEEAAFLDAKVDLSSAVQVRRHGHSAHLYPCISAV